MVLDGDYRFSAASPTPDFTYIALVQALTSAGHLVTKAHRQGDPSADHAPFDFATTLNLLDFDVLWLIGHAGRNVGGSSLKLPDPELRAIARFMAAGGGVFATGDHDSIGSNMCGHIPRVRAMRTWYGKDPVDPVSPMPASFPRNFPPFGASRADTTRQNPAGDYDLDNDGTNEAFVWFENQSDSVPQPIVPVPPTHPILRRGGSDITVFPDHMHEGNTLGEVAGHPYDTAAATFAGETFVEFPMVAGNRELPRVIATGQTVPFASRLASSNSSLDTSAPLSQTVNTMSVYDGRTVGVGRVVTGSTFHHYVDINLTGDSRIDTAAEFALTGADAAKTHGFNDAPGVFDDIKAVYANITAWLARPRPAIHLILERSTFSQAEATANPSFAGAFLVAIDGLKPNQFPGGGISTLTPSAAQLASWAPVLTPLEPAGLSIVATGVTSDDPGLNDRLQRITFIYRIEVTAAAAFGFGPAFNHVQVDASLTSPAAAAPLTDSAQITLVKSANPFMLDLANGNQTPWLSSDVRVFPIVAGASGSPLANNATRADALGHLQTLLAGMTVAQFEALETGQSASALSPFATTTGSPSRRVYNFAVARVRVPATGAAVADVRVFFRIFTSQTTAALTYNEAPPGTPLEGYKKTGDVDLPGTNAAGTQWLSFTMFASPRASTPAGQSDPHNLEASIAPGASAFFGCLIDNNLGDPYLPATPAGSGATDLPTLLMGEHQCIVAQIEFAGTPIPNGANPFTSDKLSQRNIALSAIANPGLDASRRALHTFEIEAAPHVINLEQPPDELLLDWRAGAPDGTEVRLFIPTWDAAEVVALADQVYPRHEIRAIDAHTVAVPGGGMRYIPLPRSLARRTGVITADFPLGVKRGQRFDLAVRQITSRGRTIEIEPSKVTVVSLKEAARLIEGLGIKEPGGEPRKQAADPGPARGVFDLGKNTILITDLSVINAQGDHALVVQHPDPEVVEAARRRTARWRETIGAFQLGIPVSVKADMLAHQVRLLSVLRWRAEWLRPDSPWYGAFLRYVDLIAEKVRALGGNPDAVPATPDGAVPLPGQDQGVEGDGDGGTGSQPGDPFFEPEGDQWLGETGGLEPADTAKPAIRSGKVSGLLFDHFGDFEGFTLEAYDGTHHRFFSREGAILALVKAAMAERQILTVITVSARSRRVRRLLIRHV